MKNLIKKSVFVVFSFAALGLATPAMAYSPVLSATSQGGSSVQISISYASPFSQVSLSSRQTSSLWTVVNNIGQTDGAGFFNKSVNIPTDGSSNSIQIFATVGGQQTATVRVSPYGSNYNSGYGGGYKYNNNSCTYNNCHVGGSLSLSNTSLTLSVGQSANVTVYNYGGSLYISSNSNSSIVSASVSGNQINVYANRSGSANISICSSSSVCSTLLVNVGGQAYNDMIWFSPSNPSLYTGQNLAVNIVSSYYTGGSFYVSSNSNSNVVSASLSGSTLNLYGNQNGSSNITICQSGSQSQCASVYVSVASYPGMGSGSGCGYYGCVLGANTSSVWFSQSNVSLALGQSSSVTIYSNNYGGSYYISGNLNWGIVSANVTGNMLNLSAIKGGTATVTVCQGGANAQCGNVYVVVAGGYFGGGYNNGPYYGSYNYPSITLSQTNLNLTLGQSAAIHVYGNGIYYLTTNSNSQVATAVLSGQVLNVYTGSLGKTAIAICQDNPTTCVNLTVNVTSGSVLGASIFPNGQLIRDYSTIYIVYKNTKTAFASAQVFKDLGFDPNNIINTTSYGLQDSNYIITSPFAQHPWGAWVKSGQAVYFVHESGLIPVPDWNIFLNNGGQANLLVNANSFDLQRPMLSAMTTNDYRLR